MAGFWSPNQNPPASFSDSPNKMDGHMSRIYALTFFPENDERFISGGWDDTVQVMGVASVTWEIGQRWRECKMGAGGAVLQGLGMGEGSHCYRIVL